MVFAKQIFVFSLMTFSANSDYLGNTSVTVGGPNAEQRLNQTIGNIKSVFQNYVPVVDSDSTIVSPLKVSGSSTHPELSMSVRKCLFGFCQTVDLNATVSLKEISNKNCERTFMLNAELSRSSQILTDIYDSLDVSICLTHSMDRSEISLAISADAHHGRRYSTGTIQRQIFAMLQLQVEPITHALEMTLNGN